MSPGGTPVAVIGLKLIGTTIPNVLAGNRGGSGEAQKTVNVNTQKGRGCFSQLNPLVAAQKAKNANNQKGLGRFSQLNPLVELRIQPACSTSLGFGQLAQLVELRLWPACSTCRA